MQLDITGRQIEITPALREFTEEKLRKLEKLLDGPLEVHVVLAIEKHRHLAEVQVKSRSGVLSATRETDDLYASIGEVADRLERQALKQKEKLHAHRHRQSPRQPEIAAAIEANVAAEQPAAAAGAEGPQRVVRAAGYRARPCTAEDALLELEASGENVFVYRDAATEQVHVLYRGQDGNFTLIGPEA